MNELKFKAGFRYSNGLPGDNKRLVYTVIRRTAKFVVLDNRKRIPIQSEYGLEFIKPYKPKQKKSPKIFAHNIDG